MAQQIQPATTEKKSSTSTSHCKEQRLLPFPSVCLGIFNLTWPSLAKKYYLLFFPSQPAICIKPSTILPFTTCHYLPVTSPFTKSKSAKFLSTITPPLSARSLPNTQTTSQASTFYYTSTLATDTDFPSFTLSIGNVVAKLISYFIFVAFFHVYILLLLAKDQDSA